MLNLYKLKELFVFALFFFSFLIITPPQTFSQTALQLDGTNDYVTFGTAVGVNGTLMPAATPPTWLNPGAIGSYALQFNSASNQYVSFGQATTTLGTATFTVECWFKRTGTGIAGTTGSGGITSAIPLVTKGRDEADGSNVDMNYWLGINNTTGTLAADFEDMATGLNHPINGTTEISDWYWYHAVVTYDGTTLKLFLDGNLENSIVVNQTPRYNGIQHAGLGTALNSSGVAAGFFDGIIDEARIWNYARSQSEIQASMNLEIESATGLLGRWGLNEGTGKGIYSSATPNLGLITFTLETWFKWTGGGVATSTGTGGLTAAIPLITKGRAESDGSNLDMNYFFGIQDGKLAADFEDIDAATIDGDAAGQNQPILGTISITTNVWHHAAVTYDGSTWRLYLDGILDNSLEVTNPGYSPPRPQFNSIQYAGLGTAMTSNGTAAGYFAGIIDESRFWNYARSETEIQNTMNEEITSSTGLVARFGLNEGTGTTTNNSNINNITPGTLTNGPIWVTGISVPRALTINVIGSGLVSKNPDKLIYNDGEVVTLTAIPAAGWELNTWSGDLTGNITPTTITMNSNKTITATFAQLPSTGTITFAALGDFGDGGTNESSVSALIKTLNPSLIITTGDNNYNGATQYDNVVGSFYGQYIHYPDGSTSTYAPGPSTNAFFPSYGNHDADYGFPVQANYFELPGNERYYKFVVGPVEFFAIDSDPREPDGYLSTSVQAQWLQTQLAASTATWKVVFMHRPPFSSGTNHGSTPDLQWPFEAWGADAIFSGHNHQYERILKDDNSDGKLLPYFVTGAGGQSLYTFSTPVPGSQVRYNANYGTMFVEVNSESVIFKFYSIEGGSSLIDSYTLWKNPPVEGDYALDLGSNNAYVTFGQATNTLGASSFTIESWFKWNGGGTANTTGTGGINIYPMITKGSPESDGSDVDANYIFGIQQTSNVIAGDFEDTNTGLNHPITGVTTLTSGQWYHGAITFNNTTKLYALYLNGNLEYSTTLGSTITPRFDSRQHAALATMIESDGTTANGFYSGVLDEVRIWNYARTQAEIQAAINSQLTTIQTGLLARWGLNDGSGTTVNGSAGTSVTGIITGTGSNWVTPGAPFNLVPIVPRTLSINVIGSGLVTKNPDKLTYNDGEVVTLTAIPAAGWELNTWSGDLTGNITPTTITMNSNKTITATFAQLPSTGTITFAALGDFGDGGTNEGSVSALIKTLNPSLIITTGDNNYNGATQYDNVVGRFYGQYIHYPVGSTSTYAPGPSTNAFFPSYGNHDADYGFPVQADYFELPGNERYYKFSIGPVEFFAIDSDPREPDGYLSTSVQAQWLQTQLAASTATWKVVFMHRPPFSSGTNHGSTPDLQWPFEAWGADAIFSGHNHQYERILKDDNSDGKLLPYFVTGAGGQSLYTFSTPVPGSQVRYNANYGTMFVEVNSESMIFKFYSIEGGSSLIDSYTLWKNPPLEEDYALDLGSNNAYVTFGNPSSLKLTQFTLETWFRRDGFGVSTTTGTSGIPNTIPLVAKGTADAEVPAQDINYILGINATGNTLCADFEEYSSGLNHPISGVTPIVQGIWYHAAVTYNGTKWQLFLNGELEQELNVGAIPGNYSDCPVSLGTSIRLNNTALGFFDGVLDEARIWNYARTQADILATINSQITTAQTGLIARWGLNEGNGTTVSGSAGTSVTGTINGTGSNWLTPGAPFNISVNQPPDMPLLVAPVNGSTGVSTSPTLEVSVSDPEADSLTVRYYTRPVSTTAPGPDFTIVALPDAQYYTDANTSTGTMAMFTAQTNWCVSQRSARNIVYVAMEGDITNDNLTTQWDNSVTAMQILETPTPQIPYGIALGNHDLSNPPTLYNNYFGISRFQDRPYYGGNYGSDNNNNFALFSASGMDFIVINLGFGTSTPSSEVFAWANNLLQNVYSNRRAVIVSHDLLTGNSWSTAGQAIYNALRGNPNLFLMICGHQDTEGLRTDIYNADTIYTVRSDYQSHNGGDGWMRIFTFSPVNNEITVSSYSPSIPQSNWSAPIVLPYTMSATNSFTLIDTKTGVTSGTNTSITWPGLLNSQEYEWYVEVNDGITITTSPTWSFTTGSTAPEIVVNAKVLLQGPYNTDVMSTVLNTVVPVAQPYSGLPWNYNGSEVVTSDFFSSHTDIVDWVLLELRTSTSSGTKVGVRSAFLKSDGKIVDLDGINPVIFPGLSAGDYYIVIHHRNHLAIMSANAVALTGSSIEYDFTTGQDKAYGLNPMKDMGNGRFSMFAGDGNGDGNVNAVDRNAIWRLQNGLDGYLNGDYNLNVSVNAVDRNGYWRTNNGKSTQLP